MAKKRIRGVQLTRDERFEARLLISRGCSFEEAASAASYSKKTIQRLLNPVGGMPGRGANRAKLRLSLAEREEISLGLGGDESNRVPADRPVVQIVLIHSTRGSV